MLRMDRRNWSHYLKRHSAMTEKKEWFLCVTENEYSVRD